jgi:peptidoglycan/xylan/chitin deacetylase (PgdA/CDA1 family)
MSRGPVYAARGSLVRVIYLVIAIAAWLVAGLRRRRHAAPITLCYHGVTAAQQPRFERQMRRLAAGGGAVSVTFDDAFANLRATALPVTTDLDIPVTIFAVSGNLGGPPHWRLPADHPDADEPTIDAWQLAELASEPTITIGSHGLTHAPLPSLAPAQARAELVGSRYDLERLTGRPVTEFAFPHGRCDDGLIDEAFAAGYLTVHVLDEVPGRRGHRGTVVDRFGMSPDVWPVEFALTIAGAYRWLPPLRRWLRRRRLSLRAARLRLKWPHNRADTSSVAAPLPARPRGTLMTKRQTDDRRQRILAVASGGGHWVQLLRLRPAFAGEDVTWVTVSAGARDEIGAARLHVVNDATRWSRWKLLRLALHMAWICLRERPDVVVTTGAAPGYFAVVFGRMLGARTAWIDSMANAGHLSLSGQKAGRWSDLWLTQWPGLARPEGPRYEGAML